MRISLLQLRKKDPVMSLLTHAQVIATLGPLEGVNLNEIMSVAPTLEELSEAGAWVANDEAFINAGKHLANGRVGQLVEILSSIEEEADEEVVDRA
jgi:hypothetical protein